MAGPPPRDCADVLRTARPEVGTAKHGDRVTRRNGFVTDPDVTHADVAETAACGRARRRIGNGTFNAPGTDGYDPGYDFGRGRGGPANLPVVPDLSAFAAHTARDLNEAARRTQGPVRAHAYACRPCGLPLTDRSRRHPATGVPRPDAARTSQSTPANPDGAIK